MTKKTAMEGHYQRLLVMTALSFVAMYVLIHRLCQGIVSSQQAEIAQMTSMLEATRQARR